MLDPRDPLVKDRIEGAFAAAMRIKLGLSATATAIVAAIALPLTLGWFERGRGRAGAEDALPALVAWAVANRGLLPVVVLPALIGGVTAIVSRRGLLVGVLAMLWSAGCVLFLVYASVSMLGPLYQYEDLG